MARIGITYEQVAAAADELVSDGVQPTIKAVRERLGTGSPNTIHAHMSAWRDTRQAGTKKTTAIPQTLITAIATEIDKATEQARAEMQEQLMQAQNEATELARVGRMLEIEIESLKNQMALITTERDTLKGKVDAQTETIASMQQRIEREQKIADEERARRERAQMRENAEIERLREAIIEMSNRAATAEKRAAVAETRFEDSQKATEKIIAKLHQPRKERATSPRVEPLDSGTAGAVRST